jgi:hypothetical protein
MKMVNKESLDLFKNLRMVLIIKVNGMLKLILKMAVVSRFGLMDLGTMGSGKTEWQMDGVDSFMQRVMFMKANGLKIKQTDRVSTLISMALVTKVSGIKISNMVSVLSSGLMVPNMREIMMVE